ncbi:hypothetical protein XAB3213_4170019 [Xanthomonas citri pv. bilvae]|nr:hypothetical protein XAB3213_4170019 [Xanthomonas citri pv. bilvae]
MGHPIAPVRRHRPPECRGRSRTAHPRPPRTRGHVDRARAGTRRHRHPGPLFPVDGGLSGRSRSAAGRTPGAQRLRAAPGRPAAARPAPAHRPGPYPRPRRCAQPLRNPGQPGTLPHDFCRAGIARQTRGGRQRRCRQRAAPGPRHHRGRIGRPTERRCSTYRHRKGRAGTALGRPPGLMLHLASRDQHRAMYVTWCEPLEAATKTMRAAFRRAWVARSERSATHTPAHTTLSTLPSVGTDGGKQRAIVLGNELMQIPHRIACSGCSNVDRDCHVCMDRRWCRHPDSNWGPTAYKAVALPTELCRRRQARCAPVRILAQRGAI